MSFKPLPCPSSGNFSFVNTKSVGHFVSWRLCASAASSFVRTGTMTFRDATKRAKAFSKEGQAVSRCFGGESHVAVTIIEYGNVAQLVSTNLRHILDHST